VRFVVRSVLTKKLHQVNKVKHKAEFNLSANFYMFGQQVAILSEFTNNKVS
jgi:hypothetical protein